MAKRDAGQLQVVARAVLGPVFRFAWRIRTEGMHHIPETGGALIAPNHTSVLDSFFVPLVLPRRITYVGKAEYMDDWKTKVLFPAMGMIPIDRAGGDASAAALNAAAGVLECGELFGIYPEGTRSRSGDLYKGHTGVARLALRTGCPIIPVGIVGARSIQPPDAKFPKPFMELLIRFGEPIDVSRYSERSNDRLVLRQVTDELMYSIRDLSGQIYHDSYATKQHESIPTETAHVGPRLKVEAPVVPETMPSIEEVIERAIANAESGQPKSSSSVLQAKPLVDLNF